MQQLVECVPNFSEGRDQHVIQAITQSIKNIPLVQLLDVDPGAETNRTVITFIGPPAAVLEAAFQGIRTAAELIDMRRHQGAHARMGATDVCPFVPVQGATMETCVQLARQLGERVGRELSIPVFLYEAAATQPQRQNLADIRKGEYEGLAEKLADPAWQPDFGPAHLNARSGATVIGAREFLIAYNVNLNTRDKKLAHEIALNIREGGRRQRDETGKAMKNEAGEYLTQSGTLKAVKAVGWYIPEYGRAQVSMNLVNKEMTPPHLAFDECCRQAETLGLRVTGSELVGLIPLQAMLDAGRHYLLKQGKSAGVPDAELIQVAIQSMGLNDIAPFDPLKKIIEYQVANPVGRLARLSVAAFADETSTDSPAPGGGSISALAGALGAALAAMVANLTIGKKGYETAWESLKMFAEAGQDFKKFFIQAMDADTAAFNQLMAAFSLPKKSPEQKEIRGREIEIATKAAIEVPFSVMQHGVACLEKLRPIAETGNSNALSDVGVAALMLRSAVEGAFLNIKINLPGVSDPEFVRMYQQEAERLLSLARISERQVLDIVDQRMKA